MIPNIFRGDFRFLKAFSVVICFVHLGHHVCESSTTSTSAPTTPYTTETCFNEMVRRSAEYILVLSGQEDANSTLLTCPGEYPTLMGNVLEGFSENSTGSSDYSSPACYTGYISYLGNDITRRFTDDNLKYESDSCIGVTVGAWLNYIDRKSVNGRDRFLDECDSELFKKWILNLIEKNAFSDINGNTDQCMDARSAQWIEFLTLISSTTASSTTSTSSASTNTTTEPSTTVITTTTTIAPASTTSTPANSSPSIPLANSPSTTVSPITDNSSPSISLANSPFTTVSSITSNSPPSISLANSPSMTVSPTTANSLPSISLANSPSTTVSPITANSSPSISLANSPSTTVSPTTANSSPSISLANSPSTTVSPTTANSSPSISFANSPSTTVSPITVNSSPSISLANSLSTTVSTVTANSSPSISLANSPSTTVSPITANSSPSISLANSPSTTVSPTTANSSPSISLANSPSTTVSTTTANSSPSISFANSPSTTVSPITANSSPSISLANSPSTTVSPTTANSSPSISFANSPSMTVSPTTANSPPSISLANSPSTTVSPTTANFSPSISLANSPSTTVSPTTANSSPSISFANSPSTTVSPTNAYSSPSISLANSPSTTVSPTTANSSPSISLANSPSTTVSPTTSNSSPSISLANSPSTTVSPTTANSSQSISLANSASTTVSPTTANSSPSISLANSPSTTVSPTTANSPPSISLANSPSTTISPITANSSPSISLANSPSTTVSPTTANSSPSISFANSPSTTVSPTTANSSPSISLANSPSTTVSPTTANSSPSISLANSPSTTVSPITANSSPSISLANSPSTTVSPTTAYSSPSISLANSPSTTVSPTSAYSSPSISLANSPSTTVSPTTANSSPSISFANSPSTTVSPTTANSSPSISLANSPSTTVSPTNANSSPSISLANSPSTTVSPITANSSPSISLANSPSTTVSPTTANSSPSISLAKSPSTTVSPTTANSSPSISLANSPSTTVSPTTANSSPSISLANSPSTTVSPTTANSSPSISLVNSPSTTVSPTTANSSPSISLANSPSTTVSPTTANSSPSISLANSPSTTVSPTTAYSSPSISLANSPSTTVSPTTANSSPSISLANSPSTTVSPTTANSSPSISLANSPSTTVSPTTANSSPNISLANSPTVTISTTPYTTETCFSEMVRRSTAFILVSSGQEDAVSILPFCPGEYPSIMANYLENISVNGSFISDYNDEACRSSYIGFLQNDISRRITGGTLVHNSDSCIEVTVGAWLFYVHSTSGTAIPLPECFAYLFSKWLVNLSENKAVSDIHGYTPPCMVTLYTQWIDFLALSLSSSATESFTSTTTVSSTTPTPQPAVVGCFNEIVRRSSANVLAFSGEEDVDSSTASCPGGFPSLMANILENKTLPTNSSEASEYITPICVNNYISFLISDVSIRINNDFLYYETESCMEATVGTWLGLLDVLATANAAYNQCHLDLFAKWVDGLKGEILKSDENSTDEQCVDQKTNEWMNYLIPPSTSSAPTSTSTERPTTAEVGCFNEIVRRSSAFVLFSSEEEDVGSSLETCPGGFPSLMANVLENKTLPTNSTEGSEYVAPYCIEYYVSFLISDVSDRINNNILTYETESCMEATVGTWLGLLDMLATFNAPYDQCRLDLFAKWVDGLKGEILKSDENSTDEQCVDQKTNEWMNYLIPPSTSSAPTSTSTERPTTAEVGCFNEIVRRSSAFVLFSSEEEDVSLETCPGGFPSLMANVLENKTLPTNSTEGSEYVAPYCVEYYVSFLISDVSDRINNNILSYETESCMEATVGTWLGLLDMLATFNAPYDQCRLDLFAKWVDGLKGEILKSDENSTDEQCVDQKTNEWMNYLIAPSTSSAPTSTSTERPTTAEVGCFNEIVRRSSAFVLFSSEEEDVGSSLETCPGGFPNLMANVLENKTLPTNSTEGSEYVGPYCVEYYVSFLISDVSNRINNNFLTYETESCMEATVGTWLGLLDVLATANAAYNQCHLDLFAKWVDGLKGEILKSDENSTDDQCVDRTTSEWMAYLKPTDDVNVTSTNSSTPEGPKPFPTEFCLDDMILNFSAHILQLLDTVDTPFDELTCPGIFPTLIVEILDNVTAEKTKDVSGNISLAENKTMPMDDNNIYCFPNLISFFDNSIKPAMNNSSPNVTYSCMETLLRSTLLFVDGKTAAGDEFNECHTEHLPKWLQYLQEATVEDSKDNQTDTDLCVISVTTRWIREILTPPVDTTTEALTSGTPDFNMTSSDMPSSTDPTSALTSSSTTYSPDEEECLVEPCQNGALFCPNASGIFVCNCLGSFYGELCEQIDVEGAAADIESLDFTATGSVSVVTNVMDTLISSAISVDNITALGDVTNTISSIVDKLSTASLSEEELKSVGTTLLVGSGSILSSLTSSQSNSSCGASGLCEGAAETAKVMDKVLGNTVNLGSVVLKDMTEGSFQVTSETMNLTFNKADTESLTASTKGADVALPSSLRDRVGRTGMMLAKLDIKKDIYSLARTKDNVTSAVKRLNLVTQSGGEVEDLDPDDPVVIEVDADSNEPFSTLTLTTEGATLTAVQEIQLDQTTPITIAEFEVPLGKKVLCRGRFGELPRQYERDFEIVFETDISIVVKNQNVRYQHSDGQLFVIFSSSKLEGADAFIVLEYSDSTISPSRRKRSISNPTMRSRTLAPKVWNAATLSWDVNPNLQLSGITSTGKAQFKSNFFGTFAVSEVIIAPTPIDFNRLFLNFAKYLQDSPYVLAVNCFFITMTIVIALILRRSDNVDRDLWKYYPLVDNSESGRYTYAISLHTSIRSAGNLTATPFFILIGSEGRTESRLLSDGCRKNFRPGSVSNFYLTSDVDLGAVKKLKLWHDNQGKSTNWHVDRIIVNDMQNLSKFVFLCQKWLCLEKDDGRLCRTFSAFTEDDKPDLLDIVAKQKLFDDHLWLSLVKRPTFSRFTRVQRFLCAVAMLFLSMVTSAMWYEDYDSASKQSSGLEIGPISLTFRQLYVGVMSSVIIVIPGITMTIAFKRRKFKGEVIKENNGCCSCFGYFSGKKLFPWGFIFLGYFLVVAAIGASAFFTFMYSLQWGGITSLNWLMSLVFCTSGSTGLVEPVKIIVLAVALSSVFKKSAKEDIASVAPLQMEKMNVIGHVKTREIPEPPDDNCEDIVKRRHQLVQKTKLVNIGKSLLAKLVLVGLLLVICLHSEVLDSYRLNTFVRTYAAESFISKNVERRGDVWVWLNSSFIPSMIPKYKYNNDLMPVYDQRFVSDGSNIRMGPISLRQYRVVDSCQHNILTRRYKMPMLCTPEYMASTAEINTFKEGWTSCHNTTCAEIPFQLTLSSGGSTVDTAGTFSTYGDGSYIESWDEDQTYALSRSTFLSYNDWLDINSRALIVESSLYNPNVALFTRLQVLFEFPTIGGVTYNVDVKSAKLYPYTTIWDYLVLLLQIVFMLTVLVRLCMFFRSVLCCKNRMNSGSAVVFGIEMLLSLTAMAVYGVKIDRTIFTVEELHNNPNSYVSFDLVFLLEDVFRFTLSMTLFIRILHLLEPLTFSHSLFVFRSTVIAARRELLSFTIVLIVIVTAFGCLFYLLEGPVTYDIRSMGVVYLTLFQTLLGMVKSSQFQFQETGLELYVKQYTFVIFYFSATLILVNIAIIILSTDLSAMQGNKDFTVGPDYDQELNDYFWEIVSRFLKKFTIQSKQEIEEEKAKLDTVDNHPILEKTSKIQDKLDEIMWKLNTNNEEDLSTTAQLAKKALHGLYGVKISSGRGLTEVDIGKVDRAALYVDSTVDAMPNPRLVREVTPIMNKHVFYNRRASIEPNMITMSLNDATGSGSMTITEFGSRQLTNEPLHVHDVTEVEKSKIQRVPLTPFGKVFRLNGFFKDQGFNNKIIYLLSRHPRSYEKLCIAVKGQGSSQWTCLTSTCDPGNLNAPFTTVTAFSDVIPEHVTCISEEQTYMHVITPSGVEFSLPFEPRSNITFSKGCVVSECVATFKLIPKRPYPVMQITHNGTVQLPVKVQLPVIYPGGDSDEDGEPTVVTSMSDRKWWTVPFRSEMDNTVVTFNANLAPTNIKVAYCVKLSEIEQVKRGNSDKPDFLTSDTLCGICRMIGESWGELATALGMQQPHIYMMLTNIRSSVPVNPCRHLLSLWNKQLPVAADRMRYMKAALRKIKRFDVIEWIDNHEETPRPSSMPKDLNKLKAFNIVIKHPIVCENWLRLAEACCLHQEEITLIDSDVPRTDAEKAFLVLSKWSEKYPIFNVTPLQKILMLAGFPHIANKTMDSPTEQRRRFSRLGRTVSKASLLYK